MGVYYKHPEGIRVNEIVDVTSDKSFAIAGFTGSWAIFDLENELTANILANPLSNANEREIVIDNQKFNIADCGKHFEDGTKLKINGRMIKVLDSDDNDIEDITFARITNTLKEEQIYTLLKLRLAKNVLMRKAELEQSEVLDDEISRSFEMTRVIK